MCRLENVVIFFQTILSFALSRKVIHMKKAFLTNVQIPIALNYEFRGAGERNLYSYITHGQQYPGGK